MSIRYRNPETVKLEISHGDWLLVKKHLTAGESRRMFASMLDPSGGVAPVNVGMSKLVAYLLDWSIDDANGKRVVIADKSDAEKTAMLDNLPAEDFKEILRAVEAHERTVDEERAREKNFPDGESASSPISPSLEPSGGVTNGLTTSTLMSIAS